MKKSLESYIKLIKHSKITAENFSITKLASVCINLIQIDNTDVCIMTLTVMNDGRKRTALDSISFAKLLSKTEGCLKYLDNLYSVDTYPFFISVNSDLLNHNSLFRAIKCHRIFFIPLELLFDTISVLTENNVLNYMNHECEINELSLVISTNTHSLKITKTLNKEG